MKTTIVLLLSLSLTMSISGCNTTNEDKVKNAFLTYVNEHFDSKDDLREIVSIQLVDTLGDSAIAKFISLSQELIDALSSSMSKTEKALPDLMIYAKKNKRKYKETMDVGECLIKMSDTFKEYGDDYTRSIEELNGIEIDTTLIYFFHYEVKARIRTVMGQKMMTYHVYIDADGNLFVYDRLMPMEEMPEELRVKMEKIVNFSKLGYILQSTFSDLGKAVERLMREDN